MIFFAKRSSSKEVIDTDGYRNIFTGDLISARICLVYKDKKEVTIYYDRRSDRDDDYRELIEGLEKELS